MNRIGQTHKEGTVRLLSWNVRGMNHPVKRRKVYIHLNKLHAEIIFLQETHIKQTAKALLNPGWAAQIYQSNFSTKSRGVAIIVKKQVPFIHKQTVSDNNGRYIYI